MNGTGGGGGSRRTTTSRVVTADGGRRTGILSGRPSTLCRSGTTRAVLPTTRAWSSRSRGTTITPLSTVRDRTNVSRETTVTAPGAPRVRYWMVATFTFVTLMLFTLTFMTFT